MGLKLSSCSSQVPEKQQNAPTIVHKLLEGVAWAEEVGEARPAHLHLARTVTSGTTGIEASAPVPGILPNGFPMEYGIDDDLFVLAHT